MPSRSRCSSTPGSIAPGRVPITSPSSVEKPMVVAMHRPSRIAAMLAPLPRCATTRRLGAPPAIVGKACEDSLVRQAVEAVAPQSRLPVFLRQRKARRNLGLRRVERGVEAGDLRQVWSRRVQGVDRRDVVRLVKWRQRNQRRQLARAYQASTSTGAEKRAPPCTTRWPAPSHSRGRLSISSQSITSRRRIACVAMPATCAVRRLPWMP